MTDTSTIEIVGPSPEAIDELRAEFAGSAQEWRQKAERAASVGQRDRAFTCLRIAALAARVANGGAL